ncbi:uncharacterized protein sowahb [Symphorus nematophorus]
MATDLSQDSVLQFLRSGGGSVKNSDLLQHYRNFIRDHADRDRNRELFKKFVNSVATVQQLDGVSYVVLRRKFRGRVPLGGGGRESPGPLRVPAGKNTEPSPERERLSSEGRAGEPRQNAQQREGTTPAPPGETAGKSILPAAGLILNNNNTAETNLNLKQVSRPPEVSVRPEETTPSLSQPPTQEQLTRVGQPRLGPGPPPGVAPVVRPSQQVPHPLRGREAYLPSRVVILRSLLFIISIVILRSLLFITSVVILRSLLFITSVVILRSLLFITFVVILRSLLFIISVIILRSLLFITSVVTLRSLLFITSVVILRSLLFIISVIILRSLLFITSVVILRSLLFITSVVILRSLLFITSVVTLRSLLFITSVVTLRSLLFITSVDILSSPCSLEFFIRSLLLVTSVIILRSLLFIMSVVILSSPCSLKKVFIRNPLLVTSVVILRSLLFITPAVILRSPCNLKEVFLRSPLFIMPVILLRSPRSLEEIFIRILLFIMPIVIFRWNCSLKEIFIRILLFITPVFILRWNCSLKEIFIRILLFITPVFIPRWNCSLKEIFIRSLLLLTAVFILRWNYSLKEIFIRSLLVLLLTPVFIRSLLLLMPVFILSLHQEPPPPHAGLHPKVELQPEGDLHQEPPRPPPHTSLHQEPPPPHASLQVGPRRHRHRQSYKSAVSYDDEEEEEEVPVRPGSAGGAWPLSTPLGDVSRAISSSSPCIIDQPAPPSSSSVSSSERKLPQIYIQDVKGEKWLPGGLQSGGAGQRGGESSRRSLPLEAEHHTPSPDHKDRRYSQPAGVQLETRRGLDQSQRTGLSSSHNSVFSPSSDADVSSNDWPPSGSPKGRGWNSSYEDLQATTGKNEGGSKIQEVLQQAQRTKLESVTHLADSKTSVPRHHSTGNLHDDQESPAYLSPFHHSTGNLHDDNEPAVRVMPWHLSTGDLYDNREEAESSDGSTSSPQLRQRPTVAKRLSSQLRNRMCLSLGADLDQLLQEEERGGGGGSEAARLNRLHLISSSLSLRYNLSSSSLSSCSTPPRAHSVADLAEGVEGKRGRRSLPNASSSSTTHPEGSSRQSVVPLEDREHAWLVKGAAGAWPDIYSLFREDSTLLNRQDFISGFTVLHWIAKHGDHRVLNTLWYGVEKAGLTFDINARSTCGHTPLHIAAMHGHKNIMRLLVSKFSADVKLRDTAGKKPWQYLSHNTSVEIFHLLGAPPRAAVRADGGVRRSDSTWKPEQHQRRRRRHHLSSASGERPLTIAGTVKVKRSSSLAAFLKHKSMRRFHAHQSDTSI